MKPNKQFLVYCLLFIPFHGMHGNNTYPWKKLYQCYTKYSFFFNTIVVIAVISAAYCHLYTTFNTNTLIRRRNNHQDMITSPAMLSAHVSTTQRIGEGLFLTLMGGIIQNKLNQGRFGDHISSRIHNIVQHYKAEDLNKLNETYLSNFSDEEQELLDDFQKGVDDNAQGILLHGPPGTGKSLFVREFARRSNSILLMISTSRMNTGYAGDGTETIAHLFAHAKSLTSQQQRVILFFEEIDGLGNRNHTTNSAADHSQINTLNQFLFEMSSNLPPEILIIGTTNTIEHLDASIKRCGRFDRKIEKGLPNLSDRYTFLYYKLKSDSILKKALDLKTIALASDTFSYADLAETCNRIKRFYIKYGYTTIADNQNILHRIQKEKTNAEQHSKQDEREEREKYLFTMHKESHESKWKDRLYNYSANFSISTLSTIASKYIKS